MSAWACRLDDERREALHPPVDGDVINLDTAFSQEFFDISVGQAVAQVPAHRQQDRVRREPKANERRRHRTATTNHPRTLRPAPNPSTQQSHVECRIVIASEQREDLGGELFELRSAPCAMSGHQLIEDGLDGIVKIEREVGRSGFDVAADDLGGGLDG